MNPLDLYLNRVARELRSMPGWKQEEELRELRSHLEQRVEDFQLAGSSIEEAETRAALAFGSPKALGSKLCDVWEGIAWNWWRVGTTLSSVTVLWFVANIIFISALFTMQFWPQRALLPEIPYLWVLAYSSVPFGCGALLSRRLGRRGRLVALLCFAAISLALKIDPNMNVINGEALSLPLPSYNALLAFGGAAFEYDRQKHHRLVTSSGATLQSTPTQTRRFAFGGRLWIAVALVCLLLAEWTRIQLIFHPTRPQDFLRASLLTESGMNYDFDSPSFLRMSDVPATTAAERAGKEKRIWFQVGMRAKKGYAARRIAFLKRLLASPSGRKSYGERALRLSLARMQQNQRTIQGVARLVKTPNGWKIDEKSFDRTQLWAWCYDILCER